MDRLEKRPKSTLKEKKYQGGDAKKLKSLENQIKMMS
jgi:hypothetical protein